MPVDPATLQARCDCGHELWRERRGEWSLGNRILKLVEGSLRAKCPECGSDVPIPFLQLAAPSRRLVMRLDRPPGT
jgi:hypothetical protein